MLARPTGVGLPGQAGTFAALRAMQGIVLAECLAGGVSPFAALSNADAARYGVARAVFVGRPKDFRDGYLPQCLIWAPEQGEQVTLASYAGRAFDELEARVLALVDMRTDWYAAEQQILQIRDALWPAMLRHARLGGGLVDVIESEPLAGRGLCYETVAGMEYRAFEARWRVRRQWSVAPLT